MTFPFWFFATVIGPVLLILAIYWGFWRNRGGRARRSEQRSEQGARELRAEIASDPNYRDE
ncbi:MAG TPA: hypothetical protein VF418_10545 [Sphingomonadaceae bacterium]